MVLMCTCANYISRRIEKRESSRTDMASALTTLQSLCNAFTPKRSNPFLVSHISSLSLPKTSHDLKLKHLPRAYSEELPNELIEDSKFVPLNADDRPYGPPDAGDGQVQCSYMDLHLICEGDHALLLSGFEVEDLVKVRQLLQELEGEFLEVIVCTEDMISRSLWDAMNTKQSNLEAVKIANSLPRICFLSGLTGEEMLMFIDAFPEFGIEPPVFAALVPNSADKPLQEVMEEIMGDHEMMSARQLD